MSKSPFNPKRIFSLKTINRLVLVTLGLACLATLTLPLWFGWALRTFTPKEIIQFNSYEMEGYGRFKLKGISITQPEFSISIDELSALSALNWLRHSIFDGTSVSYLSMGELTVVIKENTAEPDKDKPPTSLPQNLPSAIRFAENILLKTDKWLPNATIEKAVLIRGSKQAELSSINWSDRLLKFEGSVNDYPDYPFQLSLNLQKEVHALDLKIPEASFDLKTSLKDDTSKWIASSILKFRENTALVEASFGEESWSPESANWSLSDWELNLNTLGLKSAYSDLNFNWQGVWDDGTIANTLDGHLSTEAETPNQYLPPVDFQSEIGGTAQALSMSRFSLDAPGIKARMSEPVRYSLQQMQLAGDLRFDIDFDLGILNRDDLEGRMVGLLEISTSEGKPVGKFTLAGTDVKFQRFEFELLETSADLNWPNLQLHNLSAQLNTGSAFQVQGLIDLQARTVMEASTKGSLTHETLIEFIPEDISLGSVSFEALASGPYESIQHSGSLELESIETSVFNPLSASVSWSGQKLDLETLELTARNEHSQLSLTASGSLHPALMSWQISQLEIFSEESSLAKLTAPSTILIDREGILNFTVENFLLKGGEETISLNGQLQYPDSGKLDLHAENFDTATWLDPWLRNPPPHIQVNTLHTSGNWTQGPLSFDTTMDAQWNLGDRPVRATGRLFSDGTHVFLENIEISDTGGPWIAVNGNAPISIHLPNNEKLQLHRDDSFNLNLTTSDSQNWLDWLSSISSLDLEKFHSDVQLNGSINSLQGNYNIEVVTKEGPGEHGMPSTSILARGTIEKHLLTISAMDVAVVEEKFRVTGSVNLPQALFDRIDNPAAEIPWQDTRFQLSIPPSKLTPMRYFAPQLLSSGGEIEADLKGSVSEGISGFFRIKGMNTRAIFPFGSLRELAADLEFQQSQAKLNNISGFIGREPVTITGSLDYRNWEQPTYHFTIAGNDLPLLRKPGFLLRSDLNLNVDKASDEATAITGKINLKNGLFLLNRSNILAGDSGGGRSAATRPPYFSVDIQPLSDWTLDVAVKGDQFIRVKTPAADGVLSLDMKLMGKLREPFATGRLEFDKGNIFFPFSSFKIDYGIAELPLGNPYTPVIEIIGSSRRFGYDIGVEITGTAYEPQVHFTSSPPLSSEQIMLMVMAGENPDGMINYSTTQRASKLGAFISKGLFASDSSGNFMNRLNLNSGENLSEQGKETMEIEFLLNDRFQLIGEYDEYDFWNAGLRWNIVRRHARENDGDTPDK